MKKLLSLILALTMMFSMTLPALATPPKGAVNRVVEITGDQDNPNYGTYIVNDSYNSEKRSFYESKTNGTQITRTAISDFYWTPEMEEYVFDPTIPELQGIRWHKDGFPMRATFRTPVDHICEMKYLAEEYPHITRLVLVGYSVGAADGVTSTSVSNANNLTVNPDRRIPLYALEISNKPGVMDGRPATLHQAGNHGGEFDANEYCANLAWYLCTQYGKNEEVTNLVDTTRIYLMPYTNADGNMVSFRSATGNNRKNARSVDLNRNWAYRWGASNGSSSGVSASNHRGRGPNSEPETTAITSLYKSDNVISSISGHTPGQIIIFAWAFERNTEDAHPLLTKLAKEQTDLNGHTPQNGNVMYPQSGEINDYVWGSMRALGFTYEYETSIVSDYLGTEELNNYITADYFDSAGNSKLMKTNYGSGTAPSVDVTGELAYFANEHIALGYQNLQPDEFGNWGNLNKNPDPTVPGPWERRPTLAMLEAELEARGNFVNGKIFISHIANAPNVNDTTEGEKIAKLLQEKGALGWIVVNTTVDTSGGSGNNSGGYGEITRHYGGSLDLTGGKNFPIGTLLKGYAADLFEHCKADPSIKVTFKADSNRLDLRSEYYEWEREKPAFMKNMSFAREYANQLKGYVKDENGNDIDATLEAYVVVEGKIVDVESNRSITSTNIGPSIERSYDQQWQEIQRVVYDINAGTTDNGEYTWYLLPSKQSEYPDKGWTVTAKAPGRYTESKNVRFPVDTSGALRRGQDPDIFADPLFQQVKSGVDFYLPTAFEVDQDLNTLLGSGNDRTLTFTTYNKDGEAADQVGVSVKINGKAINVEELGNGKYSSILKGDVKTISVGFAGAEAMNASSEAIAEDVPLVDQISDVASLSLTTNANLITAGKTFGLNTSFVEEVDTNVVRITYNYDPKMFEPLMDESIANFNEAGYQVIATKVNAEGGQVQFTLMKKDMSYGFKEFYPFTLKAVEHRAAINNSDPYSADPSSPLYTKYYVGSRSTSGGGTLVTFNYLDTVGSDVVFKALDDVAFENGYQTITAVADYVEVKDNEKADKTSHIAMVTFTTSNLIDDPDLYDMIFLSNIIDAFGKDVSDPDWDTKYIFWDFVKNDRIDIADITFVARKIK